MISQSTTSKTARLTGSQMLPAYLLTGALLLPSALPDLFSLTLPIRAPLFLMAIYYWTTFRPHITPSWICFSGGLLIDLITLAPLGTHAFIATGLQKLVLSQRLYLANQPFLIFWLIFGLLYATSTLITGALHTAQTLPLLNSPNTLSAMLANMLLFPALYTGLHATDIHMNKPPPSSLSKRRKKSLIGKSAPRRRKGLRS